MNESNNESKLRLDYDGYWKRLILAFFDKFLAFFLPDLLPEVDLSRPPEFLEQELATIIPEQTAKGRMSVDKLLKFWTKNGEDKHIFVHIEVQSFRDVNFTGRVFKYFYRIYDREGKLITTIAIYTHDDVPEPHDRFEYNYQGTELIYKFNTYLVRDAKVEELEKSDNIFALVVLASKYVNRTKNDVELRRKFKLKLFRLAVGRGYSRKEIEALISFIDFTMYLPPEIDQELKVKFTKELKQEEMEKDYIISPTFDYVIREFLKDKSNKKIVALRKEIAEESIAAVTKEIEEQKKVVQEQKKVVQEHKKAVQEQKKVVQEQKKAVQEQKKARMETVRKLILSGLHNLSEVADITDISMEQVLQIKAEIDAKS